MKFLMLITSILVLVSPSRANAADNEPDYPSANQISLHSFPLVAEAVSSQQYRGLGSTMTDPVLFKAGAYQLIYSSKGKGFFVLSLRYPSGQEVEIVNRVGFGPGASNFALDADQEIVFNVRSHGSWTLDVQRQD